MEVNSEWKIKKKRVILRSTSALASYWYRFNSEHLDFFPLTLSADFVTQKIYYTVKDIWNFPQRICVLIFTLYIFESKCNFIKKQFYLADNKELFGPLRKTTKSFAMPSLHLSAVCREYSSLVKIEQKKQAFHIKTHPYYYYCGY